jgi:hypothetical protein
MLVSATLGPIALRALIPAAVAVIFALSRKHFGPTQNDVDVSEDPETYLPNLVLFNGYMVGVGIILVFGIHELLVMINRAIAAQDGHADMILYPSSAIWWFLPGFAALCLSWEITLHLWSCFSPSQARAYRSYSTLNAGFDSTRVLRWTSVVIVLPIAIATVLALPIHASVTVDEIRDGHFASLRETVYPFAQATSLTYFEGYKARGGPFTPRAGILVRFKDGRGFNTADIGDPRPVVDPNLCRLLAKRTGLPINYVRTEP